MKLKLIYRDGCTSVITDEKILFGLSSGVKKVKGEIVTFKEEKEYKKKNYKH